MIEPVFDASVVLRERVLAAIADKTPLNITGSGSKAFYGRPAQGEPLSVSEHRGIISYEPTELVMTARCVPAWLTSRRFWQNAGKCWHLNRRTLDRMRHWAALWQLVYPALVDLTQVRCVMLCLG